MILTKSFSNNFFLTLFSLIPISIVIGATASLLNILLIDILFIILLVKKKNYSFIFNKYFIYLILMYLYLLFNSFISLDYKEGLLRNIGFIRVIILFLAFNYFFNIKFFFKKVFFVWLCFFLIVLIDVQFEFQLGKNIFGYESPYGDRIVSFFKDEPIVGGFLAAFWLILIGFLFDQSNEKFKILIMILSLLFLVSIFMSGERSNTIKAVVSFGIFYFFLKQFSLSQKLTSILFIITIFLSILFNSEFLKLRFINQISAEVKNLNQSSYIQLQQSGLEIFKNNLLFGVGNKNYRVVTCNSNDFDSIIYTKQYCSTHPHQIYIEFLSEHGLIGSIILLLIFYILMFSKIKEVIKAKNYLGIGSFCYLVTTFIPILPSGAFFSDHMLTLFFINFSIFVGSNPYLNVFTNEYKNKSINY